MTPHLWLNLSEDLSWPPVCASAEKINCMFARQIIDIDSLFDEHFLVKNYNSANDRRERWQNTPISYKQKWTQLFQAFKDKNILIPNFQKLVDFIFCLPETLAPVKRIFSIMKNVVLKHVPPDTYPSVPYPRSYTPPGTYAPRTIIPH